MTTVIGLDLALASTGMVTWRDGRIFVATINTDKSLPMDDRRHRIVMRVIAQLDPAGWEQTCVTVEGRISPDQNGPGGRGAIQTALDLAELRGVVYHGLWTRGIKEGLNRAEVHPSTLKVYATGDGHASKSRMVDAARGRLSIPVSNHDEADAAWLLALTLEHLGKELCSLPNHHRIAKTRVTWPGFTLADGARTEAS